jgi:hypothetical protein
MATVSIVVFHHGKRMHKTFTDMEVRDLKEYWERVKKRYKGGKFFTVRNSSRTVPPVVLKDKKKVWCPYCAAERRFPLDEFVNVNRCTVCGVSITEYWVRAFNRLDQDGEANWRNKRRRAIKESELDVSNNSI